MFGRIFRLRSFVQVVVYECAGFLHTGAGLGGIFTIGFGQGVQTGKDKRCYFREGVVTKRGAVRRAEFLRGGSKRGGSLGDCGCDVNLRVDFFGVGTPCHKKTIETARSIEFSVDLVEKVACSTKTLSARTSEKPLVYQSLFFPYAALLLPVTTLHLDRYLHRYHDSHRHGHRCQMRQRGRRQRSEVDGVEPGRRLTGRVEGVEEVKEPVLIDTALLQHRRVRPDEPSRAVFWSPLRQDQRARQFR